MEYDVHGREGVRRWIEQWQDGFAWVRYEVTELLDFGSEFVFSLHQVAEGRASGASTELTSHSAVRFEGALVVWRSWHRERDDALRAIGVDPARVVRSDGR